MTFRHHSLTRKFPFREGAHAHAISQFLATLLTLIFLIHSPPFTSFLGSSAKEF